MQQHMTEQGCWQQQLGSIGSSILAMEWRQLRGGGCGSRGVVAVQQRDGGGSGGGGGGGGSLVKVWWLQHFGSGVVVAAAVQRQQRRQHYDSGGGSRQFLWWRHWLQLSGGAEAAAGWQMRQRVTQRGCWRWRQQLG